jgi:hypothetical protein
VLENKADHYRHLIHAGLDCDGVPVSADVALLQARVTPDGVSR